MSRTEFLESAGASGARDWAVPRVAKLCIRKPLLPETAALVV